MKLRTIDKPFKRMNFTESNRLNELLNIQKYRKPNPTFFDRLKAAFMPIRAGFTTDASYRLVNYGLTIMPHGKHGYVTHGYEANSLIYSIVKKIASTASKAPWGVYKIIDETQYAKYKALLAAPGAKSANELRFLRYKAVEPIENHRLTRLFGSPNPEQSASEYIEQAIGYKLITGDTYEYAIRNGSGQPIELYVLPSQYINILTDDNDPIGIRGYQRNIGGVKLYDKADVLHTKYVNYSYSVNGNHLYGFSPLQAAYLLSLQDDEAKKASAEVLQNRGVRGIVGWGLPDNLHPTPEMAKEQTGRLKEQWRQMGKEYKDDIPILPGSVSYTRLGLTPADNQILEICKFTKDELCNVYGVSSILFNNGSNPTYDNFNTARKDFISNVIIPELNERKESLNAKIKSDWGYKYDKIIIDFDPTCYPELEDDKANLMKWLDNAPFTENEKRIYLGEQPLKNIPRMDNTVLVSTQKIPIELAGQVQNYNKNVTV